MRSTVQQEQLIHEQAAAKEGRSLTFCLVHGSWHAGWCWKDLQAVLEARGHSTIVMDLPFEDPDAGMPEYSDFVSSLITDEANTVLVPHSRMANIVPLVASNLALHSAIYVCPGFDPEYNNRFKTNIFSKLPDKYQHGFMDGIKQHGNGMQSYAPSAAKEIFYHDCEPEVAETASQMLRPMNRARKEKPAKRWPELKSSMIYANGDRVINPDYSSHVARMLGMKAIELSGGHCPFLSRPCNLALLMEDLALCENNGSANLSSEMTH